MINLLFPWEYTESVFTIDYDKLFAGGIRGLIFDIDNTLVHHGDNSTDEIDALFSEIHKKGLKTVLLTNNDEERVLRFIANIDTAYVCDAEKPSPAGYIKALSLLGLGKNEAVCIGDQIFTDILGANRAGIPSILVKFIRLEGETNFGKRRAAEDIILKMYSRCPKYVNRLGNIQKEKED